MPVVESQNQRISMSGSIYCCDDVMRQFVAAAYLDHYLQSNRILSINLMIVKVSECVAYLCRAAILAMRNTAFRNKKSVETDLTLQRNRIDSVRSRRYLTMLQAIKPKNARSKRALDKKAPQLTENTKTALFLRYTSCSEISQLVLRDLNSLKRPLSIRFNKKNEIRPFEDPASLEFFSQKNDASLFVYGSTSKKRPHCITFIRTFDHRVLDMLELMIDPHTLRTLTQFKNAKAAVGLKPLIAFSGAPFESPVLNAYTLAKSMLLDFFRGEDTNNVDVEGLQYMVHISAGEESADMPTPKIHLRCYLIKTKKSGQSLPRVEVDEMGPRIDFRVGRTKEADPDMLRESLKRPKSLEVCLNIMFVKYLLTRSQVKEKKNISTDLIGDKVGRIHMGKQDLSTLQTRKMKGLKRDRDAETNGTGPASDDDISDGEVNGKKVKV